MHGKERAMPIYAAIDLKSFYASVECVERSLDPLDAHLVVADAARTEKTICLAVSPALKKYGISGRARLFEVVQRVREINRDRRRMTPGKMFAGGSASAAELAANPQLSLDYITAPPRMALYMEYSTRVYGIYLDYIAPEDIHVYSIDEVFIDLTKYLRLYGCTAHELVKRIIADILARTGVTATAGIGTNLYLCKIAMDIVAKHIPADRDGVRIAELDEMGYRRRLWEHRPLTDFWRVGGGTAARLEQHRLLTMGDIARCSLDPQGEELLYRLFGVNAQLLIDHAWGAESCTIADIKAYRPSAASMSTGQVLKCPYSFDKARIVVREMADKLALDLVEKELCTSKLDLVIGYDVENLKDPAISAQYKGAVVCDHYGRYVPKGVHGSQRFAARTASSRELCAAALGIFDSIADRRLLIRRINIAAQDTSRERGQSPEQLDLFTDYAARERERAAAEREQSMQQAVLAIKRKYGGNAILRGTDLQEGATAAERNSQIGGHRA